MTALDAGTPSLRATPPADTDAVTLAILSRAGGRTYNEDACGHWHSNHHLCCVLADGAGGHGGGEAAARLAVKHIIEQFSMAPLCQPQAVHDLVLQTNALVIEHRADAPAQANMHTTVICLFVDFMTGQALWSHAGDSRLYLFRQGRVVQRTIDHSVVQALVDAGALAPDQINSHPRRSELLSALGVPPNELCVNTLAEPWLVHPGDSFLLCSDGLWEYISTEQLCASLQEAATPAAWLAELEQRVLATAVQRAKPRHDNYSGIAVWFGQPGSPLPLPLSPE